MPVQHVESCEDLEGLVGEREMRISDARCGQGADSEVKAVDHVPVLAEGVGDSPNQDEGDRGSGDGDEALLLGGVLDRPNEPAGTS